MNTNPITPAQANAIWDLLIRLAGCTEYWRQNFVQICSETTEYRFSAKLGFGGKFRNYRGRPWYVDCYQEDLTEKRQAAIDAVNKELLALWETR